jgi:hypothetical protein
MTNRRSIRLQETANAEAIQCAIREFGIDADAGTAKQGETR